MPNVATVLKAEISRLARKEVRAVGTAVGRRTAASRRALADLKRRVAALEKGLRSLESSLARVPAAAPAEKPEKGPKGWISGKGVRSLRQKLGLSQEAMARLVNVTPNAVYLWERKPGMLRLRHATQAALLDARKLGAREAQAKLAALPTRRGRKA